ncbi:MAG: hypothetical protein KY432_10405, partial [Acidobacteria bacterium]|nr:hypothetical protein [Acidobacteriota bacterium]
MERKKRRRSPISFAVVIVGISFALPVCAQLEIPVWRAEPQTDPLELGSSRMEPGFALDLAEGEWAQTLTVTQFNSWELSWHTRAIHRDL